MGNAFRRSLTVIFVLLVLLSACSFLITSVLSQSVASRTIQSQGEIVYSLPKNLAEGQRNWELHPYELNYVTFESDGSIRLDPTSWEDRATWLIRRYPVTTGQRTAARASIKTGAVPQDYVPPEPWSNGARIGIDFYGADRNIVRSIELTDDPLIGGGWVHWGSDWVFRELDSLDTIVRQGEVEAIMWIQAMAHDAPALAWFKNTEFYILNPNETPPP